MPADKVFKEIEGLSLNAWLYKIEKNQVALTAEGILKGRFQILSYPEVKIAVPFSPKDLDRNIDGWTSWNLFYASFSILEILVQAYQITNDEQFIFFSGELIRQWHAYEKKTILPKGLLWNDHAISARAIALTHFWGSYRNSDIYDDTVAKAVWELQARYADILSRPSHFTYPSNHGVMQNLALLFIGVGFSKLQKVEQYIQIAVERLSDQLTYYINDEGVVLEHSPQYQKTGIEFMTMAFKCITLLNKPIPEGWKRKYQKAIDFYRLLRRPDNTLPMFGDTSKHKDYVGPLILDDEGSINYKDEWKPKKPYDVFPIAGYGIWWEGLSDWPKPEDLSQTVVAWSFFPGHAHKHADEMSVILWAKNQVWWTNVGYWPYGIKGRSNAVSWEGSNAPHLVGESRSSIRNTVLKRYGFSQSLKAIDLERKGEDGYTVRRQIVQVDKNTWIIIDHASGKPADTSRVIWTPSFDLHVSPGGGPSEYILRSEKHKSILITYFLQSEDTKIKLVKGSYSPFAGWVTSNPVSSIIIDQPADNSWTASVWIIENNDQWQIQLDQKPIMKRWKSQEDWEMQISNLSGILNIYRKFDKLRTIKIINGSETFKTLSLRKSTVPDGEKNIIKIAYDHAGKKYPRKRFYIDRHIRVSQIVLVLFILQEAFFIFCRIRANRY
ncbi:MAG: heparinase II/III family protein, partial [Deltaproteobacteria bacterium]|nr:heparinase II/III family protein [Deltaproteobacteria bacterium]